MRGGITQVTPEEFRAYQAEDDSLTYIFDLSAYLETDTISSVTRTSSGPAISNTSNTTATLTQRLSGTGYVDFDVVTAAGDTKSFRLCIERRLRDMPQNNYA